MKEPLEDTKVWKRTFEALDEVEADGLRGVCVRVGVGAHVHHCLHAHLSQQMNVTQPC